MRKLIAVALAEWVASCAHPSGEPPALPPAPPAPAARAAPAAPPLVMALLRGDRVSVVEVVGGAVRIVREVANATGDTVYWVGTPGSDALAVSWSYAADTHVSIVEGDHFVDPVIAWPTVTQPANTESIGFGSDRADVTADGRELHVEHCWFKYPDGPEMTGPCAIETVARVAPGPITMLGVVAHPEHARPGETVLPKLAPTTGVHYEATTDAVECSDGSAEPIELVAHAQFPPVVETIVASPPIVRVSTSWFGLFEGGTTDAVYEGCAKSDRFEEAVPAPDGSVVLRGADLAVVRDGHIVAAAPDFNVGGIAFPPTAPRP